MTSATEAGTVRFDTAGVRVDLVGLNRDDVGAVLDVGCGMLADRESPADVTLDAAGTQVTFGSSVAAMLSAVDRAALRHTPCLAVHAAAVAGPAGAVVLPGVSGAGKSTLAAAAMQAGLLLLSDEAACLTAVPGAVVAHARPLGLSATSRALLGLPTRLHDEPEAEPDRELAVSPALVGRCVPPRTPIPVAVVALPRRTSVGPPALVDAPRPTAVNALLSNRLVTAFDGSGETQRDSGERAWRLVGQVVSRSRVVRLTYNTPEDAAGLLARLLS